MYAKQENIHTILLTMQSQPYKTQLGFAINWQKAISHLSLQVLHLGENFNYASLSWYGNPDRHMFWRWYAGLKNHATSRSQLGLNSVVPLG